MRDYFLAGLPSFLAGAASSTVSTERIFATDSSPKPLTSSNAALLAVFRLTAPIAMPKKVKNAININSSFFIVFPLQKSNDTRRAARDGRGCSHLELNPMNLAVGVRSAHHGA